MRAFALIAIAATGCSAPAAPAAEAPPVIVNEAAAAAAACVVAVGNPGGTLTIDGVAIPDFELATLHAAIGQPDRVEQTVSKTHYEESGAEPDDPWTSTEMTVTDFHHVYDRHGLVFRTRNDGFGASPRPELMVMFFAHPRVFANAPAHPVVPADRGGCRLEINGVAVDPDADARPPGITYQTERFERYGTGFAPTSIDTIVDRIYTVGGRPHVELFLDDDTTGRPSYAEIL